MKVLKVVIVFMWIIIWIVLVVIFFVVHIITKAFMMIDGALGDLFIAIEEFMNSKIDKL